MGQKFVGPVFDRDVLGRRGDSRRRLLLRRDLWRQQQHRRSSHGQKSNYRVPRVIARIYDPRRAEIYRGLGISTIASVTWTSTRLLDMVTHVDLHSEYSTETPTLR